MVVYHQDPKVANLAEKCANTAHICTEICTKQNESATKELHVNQAKVNLNSGFAIISCNIDGKLERRQMSKQSKDNQNFDFHWVSYKIVKNRIWKLGSLP